ncbi:MAG: polysaccharide deacetylase family protein [Rubrivivax sp.]|nr:polysaccharide deacetylase family protein [Rubrivivax sp.]
MRRGSSLLVRARGWPVAAIVWSTALAGASGGAASAAAPSAVCDKPVYLTFDTGHMGVAPLVAGVLRRQRVAATFFLANERTLTGGGSLDDEWAAWWKARAAEGHAFGSHTWDHDVWRGDERGADGGPAFRLRPTAGPAAFKPRTLSAAAYCAEIERPARRFEAMTGQRMGAIFRAPGGKTSAALLQAAAACGWTHVGWSPAGFLGDELPSERYPNKALLAQALRDIRAGDVLLAHLGIHARKDPWAPAVLEPLIAGLKQRGFCFATLREHPQYAAAARTPK